MKTVKAKIIVDGATLYNQARNRGPSHKIHGAKPDYERIMCETVAEVRKELAADDVDVEAMIYSVGTTSNDNFCAAMSHIGWDVTHHILRKNGPGCRACGQSTDRFSWRCAMSVDALLAAMRTGDSPDVICIVSGAMEFEHVSSVLCAVGVKVLNFGFEGMLSPKLPNPRFLSSRCLFGIELQNPQTVNKRNFK